MTVEKNNQNSPDIPELAERQSRGLTDDSSILTDVLSPDFTMWLNFSGQTFDRDATVNHAKGLAKQLAGLRYRDVRLSLTEHGFVQQHVIENLLPSGERSKGIDACFVVQVRDGLIYRLDEYVDSGQFPKPSAESMMIEGLNRAPKQIVRALETLPGVDEQIDPGANRVARRASAGLRTNVAEDLAQK